MYMKSLICNQRHKCGEKYCQHAVPHEPKKLILLEDEGWRTCETITGQCYEHCKCVEYHPLNEYVKMDVSIE
jgi:hypothetical protein